MMNAQQAIIESLKNTFCRIKPSAISGVGVFAIRDIPADTNIFIGQGKQQWHTISMKDLEFLDPEVKQMIDDFFVIEKDKTVRIPEGGLNGMDISNFLNHSDNPNVRPIAGEDESISIGFISLRSIKKGEEITVSYSSFDWKY